MPSPSLADQSPVAHADMANALRALSMDAVEQAKSGHPGMPMGMADVATVLWTRFLAFDPADPRWPDRDRFVLSAGHGSMLLYSLLHLTGYPRMTIEELRNFRQIGSLTPGHPEFDPDLGIETTTGPLGQGISNAVGMALAERMTNARFGDGVVDHYTYVIASDGDLMEGVSHEACSLAGHLRLARLIVLYDDNHISIDGDTELAFTDDSEQRFRGYGWDVSAVDGHDPEAVAAAIEAARATDRPSLIRCRTKIGFGAPNKQGTASAHGSPLGAEEIAAAREALGWPHPPFEVPEPIRAAWKAAGQRGRAAREAWAKRHAALDAATRAAFDAAVAGALPADLADVITRNKQGIDQERPKLATRQASGKLLEALVPAIPELTGGSADLTPSNNTRVKDHVDVAPGAYGGRYIRYGVREHGMAAIMNGMAAHGGIVPYAGTFLTFSDYSRPAIRLAALMRIRVVHVMTHDSIGLGEDGPTHQPVEHVSALRAIPNLAVFRPCDAIETAECWQVALDRADGPSVIALTRQGLATLRGGDIAENRSARGAYVLREAEGGAAKAVLLATGSEVEVAVAARDILQGEGVPTRVVSMPCWELFAAQDDAYRAEVLPAGTVRVAVEAAVRHGWDRWIGPEGGFVGMTGFGESGPYAKLYEHFGITADAVAHAARTRL
ncbi:MAG: transketolase [Azospirillaceae bacterium]